MFVLFEEVEEFIGVFDVERFNIKIDIWQEEEVVRKEAVLFYDYFFC